MCRHFIYAIYSALDSTATVFLDVAIIFICASCLLFTFFTFIFTIPIIVNTIVKMANLNMFLFLPFFCFIVCRL